MSQPFSPNSLTHHRWRIVKIVRTFLSGPWACWSRQGWWLLWPKFVLLSGLNLSLSQSLVSLALQLIVSSQSILSHPCSHSSIGLAEALSECSTLWHVIAQWVEHSKILFFCLFFFRCWYQTQGLVHARQALHPSPVRFFFSSFVSDFYIYTWNEWIANEHVGCQKRLWFKVNNILFYSCFDNLPWSL
jgi:hypothetical protein